MKPMLFDLDAVIEQFHLKTQCSFAKREKALEH